MEDIYEQKQVVAELHSAGVIHRSEALQKLQHDYKFRSIPIDQPDRKLVDRAKFLKLYSYDVKRKLDQIQKEESNGTV